LSCLAAPAEAQQVGKIPRIGVIVPVEPASPTEPNIGAFRQALRDLRYVEGQNIAVECLYAHGQPELYPELVAQLIRLKVDVIVVGNPVPTLVAKNATQTIPIVGVGMGADPIRAGLVASLVRPGGNVTGLAWLTGEEFTGKWVELLKEAAPGTARVGYLHNLRNQASAGYVKDLQSATGALGLTFELFGFRESHEIDRALAVMSKERGAAFIVPGDLVLIRHASRITELAAKYRLPGIYGVRVFVDAGGLMSYGPSLVDFWRRAAAYVDKILKGAKPADLPVEQPTKIDLVINLKTAKTLGLTIPQSLLLRADEIIQ
jgi:putative ABC transport system substrate-binding protein